MNAPLELGRAKSEGPAVAFAQRELVVAVDQGVGDLCGVAPGVLQALAHHAARQDVVSHPVEHRHARQLEAQRDGLGLEHRAAGVHQDQPAHALRRHRGHAPGHLAAQRVAAHHGLLHLHLIQHVPHEAGQRVASIVVSAIADLGLVGEGAREPEPGQIQRDHAALRRQHARPAFPGVQARGRAVQQHHGLWIFARAFVAQVHHLAVHGDEVRRHGGPARHQRLGRAVGCAHQPQAQGAGDQQQAQRPQQHLGPPRGRAAHGTAFAGTSFGPTVPRSSNTTQRPRQPGAPALARK